MMRLFAPLSYWLALAFFRWATGPQGLVRPLHPAAAYCGQRIAHYERLLGRR
jgi:hypothetical protein